MKKETILMVTLDDAQLLLPLLMWLHAEKVAAAERTDFDKDANKALERLCTQLMLIVLNDGNDSAKK